MPRVEPLDYLSEMAAQKRPAIRPLHYEGLLFEPITDEPNKADRSYTYWDADHADRRHFYLAGFQHFLRCGAVSDAKELHDNFSDEALEYAQTKTAWTEMFSSKGAWKGFSYNQARHAKNGTPIYFEKAALVMLCCELAIDDALREVRKGRRPPLRDQKHESGAYIYTYMSILPACYNIDDFNRRYLESLEYHYPGALTDLRDAAGQTTTNVLVDLSEGHTVTRVTAYQLKDHIDAHYPKCPVGRVRARPGKTLGRKHATEHERVDRG